jgi:hypothetical protein
MPREPARRMVGALFLFRKCHIHQPDTCSFKHGGSLFHGFTGKHLEHQLQTGLNRYREGQLSRFLPGFRESALRASRAVPGGAAQGRGRPSDDDRFPLQLNSISVPDLAEVGLARL